MQHTEHIVNVSDMERKERRLWDEVAPNKILKSGLQARQMSPSPYWNNCCGHSVWVVLSKKSAGSRRVRRVTGKGDRELWWLVSPSQECLHRVWLFFWRCKKKKWLRHTLNPRETRTLSLRVCTMLWVKLCWVEPDLCVCNSQKRKKREKSQFT